MHLKESQQVRDLKSPRKPKRACRVYPRRQFENIWLRTKRKDADGKVLSGTGGVCYVYFPLDVSPAQKKVLESFGIH